MPYERMNNEWIKRASRFWLAIFVAMGGAVSPAQDEDASIESLYQKASEFNMQGKHEEASETFERLFDLSGGYELLFEDYGAQAGGLIFDYGMTLLPQSRWEEAKEVFQLSVNADKKAEEVQSPINSENPRKNLAKFQLGYCEAQLGNHEKALELYDEYLSNADKEEASQVYSSFKLRYGTSQMKLGRIDEGMATVQELFDNQDSRDISPKFLVQGLLELGLAWAQQADEAGDDTARAEKIAEAAHSFLDENEDAIDLDPLDQFRYGFVERLRKLGFESTKAGLYSLALRYFSYAPTIEDVKQDINLSLARLPLGTGVPGQYQQLLDRIEELESRPLPPDAETLRLVATCYEQMGNIRAPRVIYWHLAEHYPDMPADARGEVLHEASRLSSLLGDHSAAQYFGEQFTSEMPEDHDLKNNVSTFMLQSLFTSGQYQKVIGIAERVRERYELGALERELADSLYPLALYSTEQHEEAKEPFTEYVRGYPDGPNRELVMFHRASNSLVLGNMREAAEQYSDFIKLYPESERFLDNAFADLAIARFNLEDYPATIDAAESLEEKRPDSHQLPRTLLIEGDAWAIRADDAPKEQEEQQEEWRQAALDSYLAAVEAGKRAESQDSDRTEFHKETVSEAYWKAADIYYQRGEIEKGLALYDEFFPDYAGTEWEPQISIFSLEHLEEAGRGEEGLEQVEKMILLLGNQPPEEQDLSLLRKAIGSYAEASVRIRGVEETLATLDDFPGMDPENQALRTWLEIQQVIVLEQEQKGLKKDSPEYAEIESRIAEIFEELRVFEKRNLSEFALQQIGLYFSDTDNPFLAVPYFEELLARTNPEADQFKAPAEMELGKIEMRAADPAQQRSARERFRRVIDQYENEELVPEAWLNLARLHIENEEWRDALEALKTINKNKNFFRKEREKRAEAGFLMGTVLDELDDPKGANQAYLSVVSTYGGYPDWVTQAWERYIPNSMADIEAMPTQNEEQRLKKRQRELALYRLTRKFLYQWQEWTDDDAPSGALRRLRRKIEDMKNDLNITPEEEQQVLTELGIAQEGEQ